MPYAELKRQREYQRNWMAKRRADWFAENGPCVDCGALDDLEADHRDPALKISHRIWSWSDSRRAAELAKCVVRCAPCHLAKTKGEGSGVIQGERNGRAKMTAAIVVELRRRHAAGEQFKPLAREFGLDKMTIKNAIRRRTWSHVL